MKLGLGFFFRFFEKIMNLVTHWHDLSDIPKDFQESWAKMQAALPRATPVLLDNEKCREELNEKERKAFDTLIPLAYKSDLCRYVYLYKHGGLYVDMKFSPGNFPLESVMQQRMLVTDLKNGDIYNAFIAAEKGDPWLKKCIDKTIENVKARRYGQSVLSVSGPGLAGEMAGPGEREREKLILKKYPSHHEIVHKSSGDVVAVFQNSYKQQSKHPAYAELWRDRAIYKEEIAGTSNWWWLLFVPLILLFFLAMVIKQRRKKK